MFKRNHLQCSECGTNDIKYKCPKCNAPYCSATCCKLHQVTCVNKSYSQPFQASNIDTPCVVTELYLRLQEHHKDSSSTSNFIIDTSSSSNVDIQDLSQDDRLALDGISSANKLFPSDLSKLETSTELKQKLRNPHLRDYLSYINSLEYPRGFIRLAMQEPIFVEFADACLKAIHPEEHKSTELTDEEVVNKLNKK